MSFDEALTSCRTRNFSLNTNYIFLAENSIVCQIVLLESTIFHVVISSTRSRQHGIPTTLLDFFRLMHKYTKRKFEDQDDKSNLDDFPKRESFFTHPVSLPNFYKDSFFIPPAHCFLYGSMGR